MSSRAPTSSVDAWLAEGHSDLGNLQLVRDARYRQGRSASSFDSGFYDELEMELERLLNGRNHYTPNRSALKEAILQLMDGMVNNAHSPEQLARAFNSIRVDTENTLEALGRSRTTMRAFVRHIQAYVEESEQSALGDQPVDDDDDAVSYDLADHPSDAEEDEPATPAAPPVRTPSAEVHYSRLISDAQELVRRIREAGPGNFPTEFMREQQERRRQELPRRINRTAEPAMEDFESQLNGRINMRGSVAEEEALRRGGATLSSQQL